MTTWAIRTAGVLAAVALLGVCGMSRADTVTKVDGTVYTGTIQEENRTWVILEVSKDGKSFTIPILKTQIAKIQRGDTPAAEGKPAPKPVKQAGPGYYPLPIKGEIGVEAQARFLAEALADVRKSKAKYLILVFDSPGGSAQEAGKIINVIKDARKDVRVVGLIRQAMSSAAAVAVAVPDLYIRPTGRIGDATGDPSDPRGRIKPLDDASRKLIGARLLAEAKSAGHPELVARGLVDPSLELAIGVFEDRRFLTKGRGGKVISTRGQPLVLAGADAVDAGLAKGLAEDLASLHKAMGLKEWHVVRGSGWAQVTRKGQDCRRKLELAASKQRRETYMAKVGPRLEQIDQEIKDAKAKGREAEKQKRALERRYEREVKEVEADYKADLKEADRWHDTNPGRRSDLRRRAKRRRDQALDNVKRRLKPDADRISDEIRKWKRALDRLQDEKKEILRKVPR
ncbi:MAG: Clp protease/crotonase-like domain-containing protein [Planctomycetota bacterium]|jgi:hypothetical protein